MNTIVAQKSNKVAFSSKTYTNFSENFYILEFIDGIALVPNNWLRQNEENKQQTCFYPDYKDKKRLNKAIQKKEVPDLNNVHAAWAMYEVIRIFASADTFERGQEKLRLAENISDINTEDEETRKNSRHDRAIPKNFSSDEVSESEEDSTILGPLPNAKNFSRVQSKEPLVLATYENPNFSQDQPKMDGQEQNSHQTNKICKEILKKVNRALVEIQCLADRITTLESKQNGREIQKQNIDAEEGFVFQTIDTIDKLQEFELELKNEEFFLKMKGFLKLKGGGSLQDKIKNIFKALIKDDILKGFSWKGARGKHAFRNFHTVNLIIAALRLQDTTTTEDEIKKLIINWIVQAPARVKRLENKHKGVLRVDNFQIEI